MSSLLWAEERKRPLMTTKQHLKELQEAHSGEGGDTQELVDHREAEAIVQMGEVYFG